MTLPADSDKTAVPEASDYPAPVPCWLVWERAADAAEGGRPYLRAVDTTETLALRHKENVEEQARVEGRMTGVMVESSQLNHLYGASQTDGWDRSFELLRMMRDRSKGG